jgi:Sap, sulfolipid-1-addressing protein
VSYAELVFLALAAAVYPTLLAGVVVILSRPNPLRMLIAFLAGGIAISVAAGYAIVTTLEAADVVSKSNSSNKPIVDIVVGGLSLLVAWGVWSGEIKRIAGRRERPKTDKGSAVTSRALARGSVPMAFIAGVVLNLPGVWYLDALAGIAKAKSSNASALLQILVFNLIMFALVEIPIVAYVVTPQRAAEFATKLSDWVHSRSKTIVTVLATAVGLWLVPRGIVDLTK